MFDVYIMLFFGVVGYILRQLDFPVAPLVLGIVLGDMMEKNLRRGLVLSDGDLLPFFTRPISFAMFALFVTNRDEYPARSSGHDRAGLKASVAGIPRRNAAAPCASRSATR